MGDFVFIKYSGPDAGEVLVAMLSDDSESDPRVHELQSQTQRIGFWPTDDDEEDEDDEDTD